MSDSMFECIQIPYTVVGVCKCILSFYVFKFDFRFSFIINFSISFGSVNRYNKKDEFAINKYIKKWIRNKEIY